MRTLLLSALLAVCTVAAAEQPQPYVKKVNAPVPEVATSTTVQVRLPRLTARERRNAQKVYKDAERASSTAPATAAVATTAAAAATATAVVASGLPMIAASDPQNKGEASPPAPTAPTTAAPAPVASAVPGFVPGQPIATYATMAQAAQAGVDPLRENKATVSVSTAGGAPAAAASAFVWNQPGTWLPWLQANLKMVGLYVVVTLGVLGVALLGFTLMNRRRQG